MERLTKTLERYTKSSAVTDRETRFLVHPLLQYDPDAAKWIKVIRAEYFEKCKPPVPRNQDLPTHAFGELTGRTILAATSHAWFWQSHPDPEGVKLKLLRDDFIPRLRKRYPETEIVIFDDWHSCPQWPRTKEENEVFYKAMDHMNSMYLYCDVVLFLEAKLPDLDMTIRMCTLIPANYSFGRFVDVTQFHGPETSSLNLKKNDIILKPCDIDVLKSTTKEIQISYLKRPFGRPNRIPADTKRSSSVFSLAKDLREVKDESSEGTALFIAAILLQREMCETIVPMQAAFVMSVLYASDVKSNSMVSQWTSRDDYLQAVTYLGIDLAVELVVFAGTMLILKRIYPRFSAFRILMGLIRSSSELMFSQTFNAWMGILMFQNTLCGLDLSLKFEWLNCNGENATWVGGFDWDNC